MINCHLKEESCTYGSVVHHAAPVSLRLKQRLVELGSPQGQELRHRGQSIAAVSTQNLVKLLVLFAILPVEKRRIT